MGKVLIIGGGVAGMAAASALRTGGLDCCIIEKSPQTGGKASTYGCKASPECTSCGVCHLYSPELDITGVEVLNNAEVIDAFRQEDGFFNVLIETGEGCMERSYAKIVVATGFESVPSSTYNRVFSGSDIEGLLNKRRGEELFKTAPTSVAFVMCSGSRDKTWDSDYCSRACCEYGPRTALTVKNAYPDCAVKVFYIDLRGAKGEEDLRAAGIELVRSKAVFEMKGEVPSVSYDGNEGCKSEEFDYVFLCTGIKPGADNKKLADMFGLSINDKGFLINAAPPYETGVSIVGTAGGPLTIAECVESAKNAAALLIKGGAV